MPKRDSNKPIPAAARAFHSLQGEDTMLPGGVSLGRRGAATALAALVKGSNSGPGGGGDDDDSSGPGPGGDDDDDSVAGTTDR